jgi:hypothetical protein
MILPAACNSMLFLIIWASLSVRSQSFTAQPKPTMKTAAVTPTRQFHATSKKLEGEAGEWAAMNALKRDFEQTAAAKQPRTASKKPEAEAAEWLAVHALKRDYEAKFNTNAKQEVIEDEKAEWLAMHALKREHETKFKAEAINARAKQEVIEDEKAEWMAMQALKSEFEAKSQKEQVERIKTISVGVLQPQIIGY